MTICTENCNQNVQNSLYGITGHLFQRLQQWMVLQQAKSEVRNERNQLLSMSDQMLQDLGISREQAMQEAGRDDVPGARTTGCY